MVHKNLKDLEKASKELFNNRLELLQLLEELETKFRYTLIRLHNPLNTEEEVKRIKAEINRLEEREKELKRRHQELAQEERNLELETQYILLREYAAQN